MYLPDAIWSSSLTYEPCITKMFFFAFFPYSWLISGCAMCGNSLKCGFIFQTKVGQMSTDAQAAAHPKVQCQQTFWKDQNPPGGEISRTKLLLKSFAPVCWRLKAIGPNWRFLTKFCLKNFLRNSVKSLNWKVSSVPLFCLFQLPSCIFNRWAKIQSKFSSFILLHCSKYLNKSNQHSFRLKN